jgi:uncharacterized repeat protein (TIGR02543 family)
MYFEGTTATITATAEDCYKFVGWLDGVTEAQRTITMNNNIDLIANFEIKKYNLTVTAGENGTVEGGATGIDCGTKKTIEAIPDDCYRFVNWTDADDEPVSDAISLDVTLIKDTTLTANFEIKKFDLTVTAGANGNIKDGDITAVKFDCGEERTIEAIPAEGYQFVNWTDGNNESVSTYNPLVDYAITKNTTLTANFELIPAAPKKPFMKIRMKFLNSETD